MLVRPSRIATVRLTCSLTSGSWVTTTIVSPEQAVDGAEQLEHVVRGVRVELAGRLVGEQQGRLVGEGDGDRDPLLLAAGQLRRPVVSPVGQADEVEQPRRSRRPVAPRDALEQHRQLDVLPGGQVGEQVACGLLPDEAEHLAPVAGPFGGAHLADPVAGDDDTSGGRDVEAAEDAQQRALAAARRTDDGDELTRLDRQVEALQRDDLEVGDLVDLHDAVALDQRTGRDRRALARAVRADAARREPRARPSRPGSSSPVGPGGR